MTKKIKYIHIRHWDYWWGVYNIGELKNEEVSAVEFSLSNHPAGEDFYFHFDFYTLPALETILGDNEFIETDRCLLDGWNDYHLNFLQKDLILYL